MNLRFLECENATNISKKALRKKGIVFWKLRAIQFSLYLLFHTADPYTIIGTRTDQKQVIKKMKGDNINGILSSLGTADKDEILKGMVCCVVVLVFSVCFYSSKHRLI